MIFNKDRKLIYPTKKAINDAIAHPVADDDAYTNLGGVVYEFVKEKAKNEPDFWFFVDPSRFLEQTKSADIKLGKLFSDKALESGVDYSTNDVLQLEEDSVKEKIVNYVDGCLQGFLYHRDGGLRSLREENPVSGYMLHASEDGDNWAHPTEIVVDSSEEENMLSEFDTRVEVNKLIYYLKLMSELSIIKRYNIIQLIILDQGIYGASNITKEGIEEVNGLGEVINVRAASFNSTAQWSELWTWFKNPEKDIWNIRIDKFKSIAEKLGIVLAEEDHRVYNVDFINSKMTTYIQSNEELIEEGLYGDKDLFSLLSPEFVLSNKAAMIESGMQENSTLNKLIAVYEELREEKLYKLSRAANDITKGSKERYSVAKDEARPYQSNNQAVVNFLEWFYMYMGQSHERVCRGREGQDGFWMIINKTGSEEVYIKIPKKIFVQRLGIPSGMEVYILGSGYAIWDNVGSDTSFYVCSLEVFKAYIEQRRFPAGEAKSL